MSELKYATTAQRMQQLKVAKLFQHNSKPLTALDFDDSGVYCVTASADECINIYDCKAGNHKKLLYSKKYGVHLTRFTHSNKAILYASTKENDIIRYLSVHDNKFISYFIGHKSQVVTLEMSPVDDTFLSGSVDDSIRLYDVRSHHCQGCLGVKGRPSVGYDNKGLVFALGIADKVRLYDLRNFDKGPFSTFAIIDPFFSAIAYQRNIAPPTWTSLKFSNDGKNILITTGGDQHYVIDAFSGELRRRLVGHVGLGAVAEGLGGDDAGFTPDGRFVIGGSQDGVISIWDIQTPTPAFASIDIRPLKQLESHTKPSQVVKFNPRYLMMVSGCTDLAFWEPALDNPVL
ncbi:481_t:CDS:2 [Paraglomus brasilianum]|uniref:481_t:CDS:1 n=1 Tax=Paraglomus brasilianum TaxID=144538 RepID=A0A9N8ZPL5_9GLOM|nr:481_t:CDS:2 [Paraglomus brasilianum]